MGKAIAIHTNPSLGHQVDFAHALVAGFKVHGHHPFITNERTARGADLHVVLGPHYALSENRNRNTIMLDRAFWGDDKQHVSLAWLDDAGERMFKRTDTENMRPGAQCPVLAPRKTKFRKAVILADYGRDITADVAEAGRYYEVETRLHPAERGAAEPLQAVLDRSDVAIGYRGTALVQAATSGLACIALDAGSPVLPIASRSVRDLAYYPSDMRVKWLAGLSWLNWSKTDIENGKAVDFLLCH
jgi:hypothetical protein